MYLTRASEILADRNHISHWRPLGPLTLVLLRVLDILLFRKLKVRLTLYFSDSVFDGIMYLSHSSSSILFRGKGGGGHFIQKLSRLLTSFWPVEDCGIQTQHAHASFTISTFWLVLIHSELKVQVTLVSCWSEGMSRQSSRPPGQQIITLNNMLGMLGSHYGL